MSTQRFGRKISLALIAAGVSLLNPGAGWSSETKGEHKMSISKITPILVVDSVEANLPFWKDQLGYEVVQTVPHGKVLGFAILKREESELMIQSEESLGEDLKTSEKIRAGSVLLYADVESLDQALKANKDGKILIPKRKTSYGATESWLKTPSGTILGLAEFKDRN